MKIEKVITICFILIVAFFLIKIYVISSLMGSGAEEVINQKDIILDLLINNITNSK